MTMGRKILNESFLKKGNVNAFGRDMYCNDGTDRARLAKFIFVIQGH